MSGGACARKTAVSRSRGSGSSRRTATVCTTITPASATTGRPSILVYTYERRGGGPGFAGDWVSTSEQVDTVYVMQVRNCLVGAAGERKDGRADRQDRGEGRGYA